MNIEIKNKQVIITHPSGHKTIYGKNHYKKRRDRIQTYIERLDVAKTDLDLLINKIEES